MDKIGPNILDLRTYRELKQCGKDGKASSILQMKELATEIMFELLKFGDTMSLTSILVMDVEDG